MQREDERPLCHSLSFALVNWLCAPASRSTLCATTNASDCCRAARTGGGFRLFTPEAVERIRFIKQAQEIGLSLGEIRELLTVEGGANECQRVSDLLRAKLAELDDQIKAMRDFRRTLSSHLQEYERELNEKGKLPTPAILISGETFL
jgi:DNA-binding transcriptional MerR regulator